MTKEVKIIISIALGVLALGVLLFIFQPEPVPVSAPIDSSFLVREGSHMTGKRDAKVTIVEFGDYECPACALAEPAVERLREEYKNNEEVNFVFRHFPLPQHTRALVSAEVAEAAGQQGKFWEMSSLLYKNQKAWANTNDPEKEFVSYGSTLGLDIAKFKDTWKQSLHANVISSDHADGEKLGVNSTPTFFVNGEKTKGYSYDELKSKITAALAR